MQIACREETGSIKKTVTMARVRGGVSGGVEKKNGMKGISEGGIKKKSFCGKEDILVKALQFLFG